MVPPTGQHRIYLVPGRPGLTDEAVHDHWVAQHGPLFQATPGLADYLQNRMLVEERARLGRWVCSETWFPDRATELAGFRSGHYREVVIPDERRFLDRDAAWVARIVTPLPRPVDPPPYRVLTFGALEELAEDEDVAELDRDPPTAGAPRTVRSWWTDSRAAALEAARGSDGFAFACQSR